MFIYSKKMWHSDLNNSDFRMITVVFVSKFSSIIIFLIGWSPFIVVRPDLLLIALCRFDFVIQVFLIPGR